MTKTINDLYIELLHRLRQAEVPQPELEARELTAKATGMDKNHTANWGHLYLTEETVKAGHALADRRAQDEPLAYILGEWDFYGLTFTVTPDVLIPRSDTERLCELAIQYAAQMQHPRVLDLCCGTGCIGISLVRRVNEAFVTAMDISEDALSIARDNARRNNVSGHYVTLQGDVLQPPALHRIGQFHLLLCNPPYITAAEMRELDISVRDYEPILALYGGDDGLDFYRSLAAQWQQVLLPGALAMVECGHQQGALAAEIFREHGWLDVKMETDYSGVPRYVIAMAPIG